MTSFFETWLAFRRFWTPPFRNHFISGNMIPLYRRTCHFKVRIFSSLFMYVCFLVSRCTGPRSSTRRIIRRGLSPRKGNNWFPLHENNNQDFSASCSPGGLAVQRRVGCHDTRIRPPSRTTTHRYVQSLGEPLIILSSSILLLWWWFFLIPDTTCSMIMRASTLMITTTKHIYTLLPERKKTRKKWRAHYIMHAQSL